jgi:hypothetical protein
VEVGEQGERDAAEAVGPVAVTVGGIDADTQNLGVGGEEAVLERFDAGYFGASRGGEVEGVEQQHHVPFPLELIERNLSIKLILQGESRRVFSS